MIAFRFVFPGGQYHATPWGKNVNEADVAWPPEPVRLLRGMIATWWRKADQVAFPKPMLDDLIDGLAAEAPVFHLPEAVHTQIRAFMPAPEARRLVFDAFLKVRRTEPLIVAWPTTDLPTGLEAAAEHLLERMGYLGRAESWAEGSLCRDWDGTFNTAPRSAGAVAGDNTTPIDVVLPRSADDWRVERERQQVRVSALKGAKQKSVESTLPARLCDALTLDTADWHAAGWSPLPPALRRVVYDRPEIGPLPRTRHSSKILDPLRQPNRPEIARFVLAGRPRPRVEDTLRLGELLRAALMSRCPHDQVPSELSGRGTDNRPLRDDPQHAHAFYLPEDADGDGWIDHLIVYARVGFSLTARRAFDRLTALYVSTRPASSGEIVTGEGPPQHKEWRVALDQVGALNEFKGSPLLGPASSWISATPYLMPRYGASRGGGSHSRMEAYRVSLLREWTIRFPDQPEPTIDFEVDGAGDRFGVRVGDRVRSTLQFARTRSGRRGGPQPDAAGASLCLRFDRPVAGPIALGKHAHFGMGLFRTL